jgi:beta-galactosidase
MNIFFKAIAPLLTAAFAALFVAQASAADLPREHLSLDLNWKFHLGDNWPNAADLAHLGTSSGPIADRFNDSQWPSVNLPHDWAVPLPFDKNGDDNTGYRQIGPKFPTNSIGWYRRTFEMPAGDSSKRIWLTFDGAFRDTTVWVNGWLIRHHEGGYNPFREDITDVVRFGGRNTIAVRVDATKYQGWYYEGAGIYRHVWLDKTEPVAIAPDGIFVWSEFPNNIPEGPVKIRVKMEFLNMEAKPASIRIDNEIFSPDGKSVAKTSTDVLQTESYETPQRRDEGLFEGHKATMILVPGKPRSFIHSLDEDVALGQTPILWSPENPKLYKLVTTVESEGKIVDQKETTFGIRTLAFDPTNGFLLNGKRYELQGVCIHQDWAGVGVAVPDSLQPFRVTRMKEMGCNAVRTAHNPPSTGFLDACDRLGLLVMDEDRVPGADSESMRKWDGQIRRDRNHPSVAIWSLGNEERGVEDTPQGAAVARVMQDYVKKLDPTRPVTYAAPEGNVFRGINSVIEVRGWNYFIGPDMDKYHAEHPTQPEVCTEQASIVSTRGIYTNDRLRGYISSYDTNWPGWSGPGNARPLGTPNVKAVWSYVAARPWLSGAFIWAGFDYGGEPPPYSWPALNCQYGIMDRCGFPKNNFYYFQSWWQTNPVLHLLPHWNWPGKEGQEIRVVAYSNCKSVELLLNGTSLGRQVMEPNSDLAWQVKYAPGTLSAKGYDANGKVIAETKVETTGDATQIQLTPDRKSINADGEDVAVFTISALDAQGRVVPVAMNKIAFSIEGAGKIIGVGNGDPACHEPDSFLGEAAPQWSRSLFNGLAQIIVQSTSDAGEFKLTASADGLTPASTVVQTQLSTPRPSVP